MKLCWFLALVPAVAGCPASGDWSSSMPPSPPPPMDLGDASTPARDGGRPSTGHDPDAGAATDGGPAAPGSDAGAGDDGGTAPTADGGTPAIDSGTAGPTADCTAPIDASTGGLFMIDTCVEVDRVAGDCAPVGARDALFVAEAPFSGSTYQVRVPDGWIIQQVDDSCRAMLFSCGPVSWGVSGAVPWRQWRFAIAKADGSCGAAMVEIERTM